MRYVKFIDSFGNFRFKLHNSDGKMLLKSNTLQSINSYDFCIRSIRDNAPFDFRYEKRKAADSLYYFVLKSIDDKIIAISDFYNSMKARDKGIEAVKKLAPDAHEESVIERIF